MPADPDDFQDRSSGRWMEHDRALARLEDVLEALPTDRALPDLGVLLDRARIDVDQLRADERAGKLIHEALLARPFGTMEAARGARLEVELLVLELDVLVERASDPAAAPDELARVESRLREVRGRLEELRRQL